MAYLNIVEVESAIAALANANPGLCELIRLPETSVEGRECHAIRIGRHPAPLRDAICLIGGVHAREWGSCEILVNLAADLLDAYSGGTGLTYGGQSFTTAEIKGLVEELNWIIFPLVNPDGRLHSQTVDSQWRKNRSTAASGGDPAKIGVDLNRNHDFLWNFRTGLSPQAIPAVSDDPLDETFHGSAPYSEPETRNVRWLLDQFPRVRWFFDVHCFSGLILYNWGDDDNQSTDPGMNFLNAAYDGKRGVPDDTDYAEFISASDLLDATAPAEAMRDAIRAVRGTEYFSAPAFSGLYLTTGTNHDHAFARHLMDPAKNKIHGYTLEWGKEQKFQPPFAEMEEIIKEIDAGLIGFTLHAVCGGWTTDLLTDRIVFNDVPEQTLAARAIVFSVHTCHTATFLLDRITLDSGPGILGQLPSPTSNLPAVQGVPGARESRIWLGFQPGGAGTASTGTVVVRLVETGQTWTIPVTANVIRKPSVATVLALDQSASMEQPSGISSLARRIDVLRFAAPSFVHLLRRGDGIGIVAFDHDAHDRMAVRAVNALDGAADAAHSEALTTIADHDANPSGNTAIGDGVERAHDRLEGATGFDQKAIVVFTDGFETAAKRIADVSGLIDERVFGIGLGTAEQVQPGALTALTNGTGGYLLLTGALNDDNGFLLNKYFMQVLAGVTNQEVVLDPDGWLPPGARLRIPFDVTEADTSIDTILVSQAPPQCFVWHLESPAGDRVDTAVPGVSFAAGTGLSFYRLALPVAAGLRGAHSGRWHAVIEVDPARYKSWFDKIGRLKALHDATAAHGPRYAFSVQAASGVRLVARAAQDSFEPGATITVRAVLAEYGIPIEDGRGGARAEIEDPDGTRHHVALQAVSTAEGVFECRHRAALGGVYRIRVLAAGRTLRGRPFTREQLLSAAVWKGGDKKPPAIPEETPPPCSPCSMLGRWWSKIFCREQLPRPR